MSTYYDRRIRRIFPALILVLVVTLLFAVTITVPVDTRRTRLTWTVAASERLVETLSGPWLARTTPVSRP